MCWCALSGCRLICWCALTEEYWYGRKGALEEAGDKQERDDWKRYEYAPAKKRNKGVKRCEWPLFGV